MTPISEAQSDPRGPRRLRRHTPAQACHPGGHDIAQQLRALGLEVEDSGAAVVGTLRRGLSRRSIGLCISLNAQATPAGNDAAPSRAPQADGATHSLHGHAALLLDAARQLTDSRDIHGIIHFFFVASDSGTACEQSLRDAGLLSRYPLDALFAVRTLAGPAAAHAGHIPFSGTSPSLAPQRRFGLLIEGAGFEPVDAAFGNTLSTCNDHTLARIERTMRRVAGATALTLGAAAHVDFHREHAPRHFDFRPEGGMDTPAQWPAQPPASYRDALSQMLHGRPGCYALVGIAPSGAQDRDAPQEPQAACVDAGGAVAGVAVQYLVRLAEYVLPPNRGVSAILSAKRSQSRGV